MQTLTSVLMALAVLFLASCTGRAPDTTFAEQLLWQQSNQFQQQRQRTAQQNMYQYYRAPYRPYR